MDIKTEIGKIYCKYNQETDQFDMMRLRRIDDDNGTDGKIYVFDYLDENFHMTSRGETHLNYEEIKKNYTLLQSEGIVAVTNIVAVENEVRQIKDVLVIYFPNNKNTGVPDANQPYIVARQGIDNIFAEMAGVSEVGMSVSLDNIPSGYALSDFMANTAVISSYLCHVYKTDTETELFSLLSNAETANILEELFSRAVNYKRNTIDGYEFDPEKDSLIVDGYCKRLDDFLVNSEFMLDIYTKLGVIPVDFECKAGELLSDKDKVFVSSLLGGVHIEKAVPLKFDYTIDMNIVKMKYFLALDTNSVLWIVPYTVSNDEVDADSIYNLNEEATIQLQERLRRVVKAYENGQDQK